MRQRIYGDLFMNRNIIAAVRSSDDFDKALASGVAIIFDLAPSLTHLKENIKKAHSHKKKLFIHLDLAEGIGKDKCAVEYLKDIGIDGIISTRTNIIRYAKESELFAVQRFFIVDSHSIDTATESLKASKADMAEIMPGIISKAITGIKKRSDVPLIAGGLIETEEELKIAFSNGVYAVSTGKSELWK